MYITEIEIDNFKTFARKTKIPFMEGFTVISGPNGSGKSNIIDSILFCLALSSARSLRAEKLTDFINLYSGKNTAEVSITFSDNTKISRKIKRTSQNYYSYNYINDRLCKQADIVDYLAKHGIKSEGYNVVMQGDITRIIEMSDIERRSIIDEIAGVAEFDKKKEQSIKQLDAVKETIERELLILDELEARLKELEKEKDQAEKYVKLNEKLESLKHELAAAKLRDCLKELQGIALLEAENKEKLSALESEKDEKNAAINEFNKEILRLGDEIEAKSGEEYRELLGAIESAKAQINFLGQNIEKLEQTKETKKAEISKLFANIRQAETKIAEDTEELRKLSIDRSGMSMELAGLNADLDKIKRELEERSKNVEGAHERLTELMNAIDKKRNEKSGFVAEQSALIERSRLRTDEIESNSARLPEIEAEIAEISTRIEPQEKLVESLKSEKSVLDTELSSSDRKTMEIRKKLSDIGEEKKKLERELAHLEAQQRVSGGPGGRGLEEILNIDGVYGTVGQLGRAPPEYADALSIAAGGRMSNVICESDAVAADCIKYLRENNLGRATFLPLNKLKVPDLPLLGANKKIIDYAVNLLDFDPLYEAAFRYVFGATVVVEDLSTARTMTGQYRMVTLAGDIVEKAGAMTGGSINRKGPKFGVSAEAELEKIRSELSVLYSQEGDLNSALERINKECEDKRNRRTEIQTKTIETEYQLKDDRERLEDLSDEKKSIEDRISKIADEKREGSERLAVIEDSLEVLKEEIGRLVKEQEKLNSTLENTGIPELTRQHDELSKSAASAKERLDNKDNNINAVQLDKKHYVKRVEELKGDREKIESEISAADAEIKQSKTSIEETEKSIKDQEEKLKSFSKELTELRKKQDSVRSELRSADTRVIEINGEIDRLGIAMTSLEERKTVLAADSEMFRQDAGDVTTELSAAELAESIDKTERDIRKIGAVNMLAIEEYTHTNQRAVDKREKTDTLGKERDQILDRIAHYEKMKFDTFMEAFNAIDNNFRKIFARVTEGKGSLILDNPEDPFSGGMTFAVQPRGKTVHLLSALSGGEKSMTTLSFIFAIQQYMPAPFYALDEVDMMLDGSNVEIVSTMIAELSKNAQTICVSLRRPTIDRSDRIIGVTIRPDKSTYVTGVKSNG